MTFCSVRTALQNNGRSYYTRRLIGCTSRSSLTTREERNLNPLLSLRRSLSTTTATATSTSTSTDSPPSSSSSSQQPQQKQERLIPTRHSSKGPPPVCRDVVELQELTQQLLETPVGSLFCQNASMSKASSPKNTDDRDEAYAIARESGELVEYLLRGYNRTISPLTLCGGAGANDNNNNSANEDQFNPEEVSVSLETMMDVMERFNQEGEMYHRLRREALNFNANSNIINDDSSSDSSSSSSSSSENDNDNDDSSGDERNQPIDPRFSSAVQDKLKVDAREQHQQQLGGGGYDFAVPGVTTAMYDTVLDAMACAAQVSLEQQNNNTTESYLQLLEPDDLYRVAGAAWKAHDLNNQHADNSNSGLFFPSTVPTMVTYNATLRGIGNLCLAASNDDDDDEQKALFVDQGLAYGFGVYNHITHNDHGLPKRNAASIIYLLQIIKACIPPSRTRGNMTVALWHQASMEGLVTPQLIQTVRELHVGNSNSNDGTTNCNGPEFDVFLESLDKCAAGAGDENINTNSSNKVIITPQRFARFAKKYSHSKFY